MENFTWVFVLMQVREIQKLKGCEAGGIKRRVGVIRPAGEEGLASWMLVSGQAPARFWNCQLCLPSDGRLPKEGQAGGLFKSTQWGRNPSPPPHSPPSPVPSSAPCGGILSRQRVGKLLDNGLTGPRPELQGVSVHCCKMEGSSDGAEEILDMNG